jgi:altronate dehydratase large subunit
MTADTFLGYPRPDGSFGTRNHVLLLPSGLVATKIRESVRGTETVITADHGVARSGRDRETIARTMIGFGRNPNVAATIVHEGIGHGYPELDIDRIAAEIARSGKPVEVLRCGDEGADWQSIERGIRLAQSLVHDASRQRRVECPASGLTLGVKCGGSDPTSGLAGNPAVGCLFDRVIAAGGTAIFGETVEVIGAEHILARRAATPAIARELLARVQRAERSALATGEDIRTINPVPANIKAGISTLEEKSLGALHKAGSAPLNGVLDYGERPPGPGLYFADTYAWNQSIFGSHIASGANLTIFQFGGTGTRARTLNPSNVPIVPLMWTTASPVTYARGRQDIDFYSGTIIEGSESLEEAGARLYRLVLEIASGTLTRTEMIDYLDPLQLFQQDPMF